MATEIRTVALGVPQVFRQPQGRSFLAVPGVATAGTMLIEYSQDGVNFIPAAQGASLQAYSFCPDSFGVQQQGYVRFTAAVAAGLAMASDTSQIKGQSFRQETVFLSASQIASQVALTTEQPIWSIRFPAGALPANFAAEVDVLFGATNNANVKTLKFYLGPTGNLGTALASIAVTSFLNGHVKFFANGLNDFVTVKGGTVGSGLGEGGGAVALVSTTIANWALAEQEMCITATKATAADVLLFDRVRAILYTQ